MEWSNLSHRFGLIVALIIVGVSLFFFMNQQDNSTADTKSANGTSEQGGTVFVPTAVGTEAKVAGAETTNIASSAIIKTNKGEIEVSFFGAEAPKTVENFQKLSGAGFYTNTKFHRVIKGFMIQGGDPFTKEDSLQAKWGTGGPGYMFEDEINAHKIVRGALAMANAGPGTNGSQFFIVTAQATPWLDGAHTVFGKVVRGMDIVDLIESTPTGERDIPKSPIVIEAITIK